MMIVQNPDSLVHRTPIPNRLVNNCLDVTNDRLRPFHRIPMALRYEFFLES